jgi:hypothetical protein
MFAQLLSLRWSKWLSCFVTATFVLLGMSTLAAAQNERPWSVNVGGGVQRWLGYLDLTFSGSRGSSLPF